MLARYLALLIVGLVLTSCAVVEKRATDLRNPIVGRELAGPDTFLGPLPTAFVLLSKDLPKDQREAFCKAFFSLPEANQVGSKNFVAQNVIRTRWVLTANPSSTDEAGDCKSFLIDNYAFSLLDEIRTNPSVTFPSGNGPFLVFAYGDKFAVVDGSSFTPTTYAGFISSWNAAMGQIASQWKFDVATAGSGNKSFSQAVWDNVRPVLAGITGQVIVLILKAGLCLFGLCL